MRMIHQAKLKLSRQSRSSNSANKSRGTIVPSD